MSKKKLAVIIAIGLTMIALIAVLLAVAGRHEITVTQNQLQERIDAALGQRLAAQERGAVPNSLVISSAHLELVNDKIAVAVVASGNQFEHAVAVDAKAHGKLRYESLSGSFYFDPDTVELTKLEIDQLTVQQSVSNFIDKWVSSPKVNERKDAISMKAEVWVRNGLQRIAVHQLQYHPVYTLPGTVKGHMAKMMLQRVEVKNGTIVLQMSYLRFAGWCLLYALVFVVGVLCFGIWIKTA
jgi:hypothetical protein